VTGRDSSIDSLVIQRPSFIEFSSLGWPPGVLAKKKGLRARTQASSYENLALGQI
jgi:hypothetical protein